MVVHLCTLYPGGLNECTSINRPWAFDTGVRVLRRMKRDRSFDLTRFGINGPVVK